jgi:uncharacterized membrane protein YgdD (TMEM256/DUF423 family)
MKKLLIIASILGATGVILGAFGAHALKSIISEAQLLSYQTGILYHLLHSIVLLIIAILYQLTKNKSFLTAGYLMFAGILLFSFSIYLLALKDFLALPMLKFLGPVTPIGGTLIIISWVLIFINAFRLKND